MCFAGAFDLRRRCWICANGSVLFGTMPLIKCAVRHRMEVLRVFASQSRHCVVDTLKQRDVISFALNRRTRVIKLGWRPFDSLIDQVTKDSEFDARIKPQ